MNRVILIDIVEPGHGVGTIKSVPVDIESIPRPRLNDQGEPLAGAFGSNTPCDNLDLFLSSARNANVADEITVARQA